MASPGDLFMPSYRTMLALSLALEALSDTPASRSLKERLRSQLHPGMFVRPAATAEGVDRETSRAASCLPDPSARATVR